MWRPPRPILAILLLALLLRLSWGLTRPVADTDLATLPDQLEYLQLGRSLLAGNGLALNDPRFPGPIYAHRTPGYPLLIALTGGSIPTLRIAQALLDTSTVLAAYLLARRWVPSHAPLAALAIALSPLLIYHTGLVLTETLFTSLLAWGVLLLLAPPRPPTARLREGPFLLGLTLLALAVLVRPGALALPTLLAIASALARPQPVRLPVTALALLITALVLLPWAYRNHRTLGVWVWTSTNRGITAYDGWNPAATGASDQGPFLAAMPHLAALTETQRDAHLHELARNFLHENPRRIPSLVVQKVLRTWTPAPAHAPGRPWTHLAAGWAYAALLWPLALIGILRFRYTPDPLDPLTTQPAVKLVLLTPALYFTLAAILTVGSVRYRLPAEPLLAVLAAAGVAAIAQTRPPKPASN